MFDTGPLISLTLNNLLWIIKRLKHRFDGRFVITPAIRDELIDRPLRIKKFKFEALQAMRYINEGILEVDISPEASDLANALFDLANAVFIAKGRPINIVHRAEMEALAFAITSGAEALVVDERTTTALVEDLDALRQKMENKLHTRVTLDLENLHDFKRRMNGVKIIRSVELVLIAYEMGLLDRYLPDKTPEGKRTLLDAVLWGVKLDGCAISADEIDNLMRYERRR